MCDWDDDSQWSAGSQHAPRPCSPTPRRSTLHTTINPRFVGVGVGHVAWSEQTRCALCDSHQLSQLAIPTPASCSWGARTLTLEPWAGSPAAAAAQH